MAINTTTLNAGAGGDKVLHDTLSTVNGSAAPSGAVAQVVKQAFGAPDAATLVDTSNPLPAQAPLRTTLPTTRADINVTTATTATIVAAVSGQTTRVHRLKYTVSGATTVTIRRASTVLEVLTFAGPGAVSLAFDPWPWYVTGANEAFTLQSSAAVTITGSAECVTSA